MMMTMIKRTVKNTILPDDKLAKLLLQNKLTCRNCRHCNYKNYCNVKNEFAEKDDKLCKYFSYNTLEELLFFHKT
jgi:hypothetical protein